MWCGQLGYSPLHQASQQGHAPAVDALLLAFYVVDNTCGVVWCVQLGYTPLHQASQQGHAPAVNALLKHRADPNALTAVSRFSHTL